MSIINKMLQDLDKRNGRPGGEAIAGDVVRSVKSESPWRLGRNAMLLIGCLVAASLAGFWWLQQRAGQADGSRFVVPAPPVPVLAKSPAPAASDAAPAAVAPAAAAASTEAPGATVAKAAVAQPATPRAAAPAAPAALAVARGAASAPNVAAAAAPVTAGKAVAMAPPPAPAASAATAPDRAEPHLPPPKSMTAQVRTAAQKTYSPKQLSANLLAEAVALDRQGRQEEAKAPLLKALADNPADLQARQMLIQLQLDTGSFDEAGALAGEGLRLAPDQSDFRLTLARLKVQAGDVRGAIQLMEAGTAAARDEPQYHALLAALLLREHRYDESAQHYLVALRSDPMNVSWLVGVGVAFEGLGKPADAAEAYRRADGTPNLTPELASFLSDRLARIGR